MSEMMELNQRNNNNSKKTDAYDDADGDIEQGIVVTVPEEPKVGQGFLKPVPETTLLERIAASIAGVSVLLALLAIVWEFGAFLVVIGGVLSCLVSPYAYYQQTLLTDIRTLKETEQELERQVDRLSESNGRLSSSIDTMQGSVERLGELDEALAVLTKTQGQSIETFRGQVQEAQNILQQMQSNHKAAVLQNLLTVIFRSDTDGDNTINQAEMKALMNSIRNAAPGIRTIHEDRFAKAVLNQPVGAVVTVIENLLKDDVPPEQRIFEFDD